MKKFFAILFAVSALVAVSCNNKANTTPSGQDQKEEEKPQVDLTELNALIAECEALLSTATTESFTQKAIDDFTSVVNTVKQAAPLATSQAVVNNLIQQLSTAKQAFQDSELGAIPSTALAWALDFEEGTGTSLTTKGQNNWVATLENGASGNKPTFVDGHKAGSKGMQFGDGAHLKIAEPTVSVLEAATFSIALWINSPINENNYILSWNKWETWKFQTQSTHKAFLTVRTQGNPDPVYIEKDGNSTIPEDEWHHIAVTLDLTNGVEVFYLDGEKTYTWDSTNSPLTGNQTMTPAPANTPLLIGLQDLDCVASESKSYFVGKMDDIQFYSIALDEGQVAKLFADQNK